WQRLTALQEALASAQAVPPADGVADPLAQAALAYREKFMAAMDDDANTALAIAGLFEFVRLANSLLAQAGQVTTTGLALAARTLRETAGEVLGILPPQGGQASAAVPNASLAVLIELVLEWRRQARAQRDWATADRLRARLEELGVVVEDTPAGTRWRYRTASAGGDSA
ncbi:MAG: hypothetical protein H5U01_10545, partial [Clostridia bacterium]|nr:hypothetical protein [Clostridia bacterium]